MWTAWTRPPAPRRYITPCSPGKPESAVSQPSAVSPQILLHNSSLGSTVDETEALIKRHEAFEKLLSSQEDKVCSDSG